MDDSIKTDFNSIIKRLNSKINDFDSSEREKQSARERKEEFEFIIDNRDVIDYLSFEKMNLSFPKYLWHIFIKHFDRIRAYKKANNIKSSIKINSCKFKFNTWRITLSGEGLPVRLYVLVDDLSSELENAMLYKPKK
jgi:hypothetical protein